MFQQAGCAVVFCFAVVAGAVVVSPTRVLAAATARGGGPKQMDTAVVLTAIGDSTASGVGARSGSYVDRVYARLVQAGRGRRLVNLAQSGATTGDVLRDQVPRVSAAKPGLVVIGVGVNDLTSNVTQEDFARRFESLILAVRARTDAPIVASNLPDVSLAPSVWAEVRPLIAARVDHFNGVISRLAAKHGFLVFDACAMTRQNLPKHPDYVSPDGYHPSDKGYEAWAEGLWPIVERAL